MALFSFNERIESIISRIGRTVQIRTQTQSGTAYNPTLVNSDLPAIAAVFKMEKSEGEDTIIESGDRLFLISSTFSVTKQDKIVDAGVEYHIVSLENVGPGDENFYYRAHGRL